MIVQCSLRQPFCHLILVCCCAWLASPAAAAPTTRPNIFFAIADDWSWPHAGVYGDTCVKTPTFDRVAREGILFTHSFPAASSCTPSRAAILTGQWPHRLACRRPVQ